MKTMLIATDFSTSAQNASKYGVELASALGMRIVLFHSYTVPLSIPESYVIVNPDDIRKTAEDYLLEEVKSLRKSELQPIEILAVEGSATDSIINQAKKYEDCIIVAGMKGEGGMIKKTFGSIATGLARKSPLPLIIVPEAADFKPIKKIALATEMDVQTELKTLEVLKSIGQVFKSKVHLVKVLKNKTSIVEEVSSRYHRIYELLKPLKTEYNFPRGEDVTDVLQDFSIDNNVDMLAIIPHHHSITERIFVKSETRQLIFHTQIPLLVLPEITQEFKEKYITLQKQYS